MKFSIKAFVVALAICGLTLPVSAKNKGEGHPGKGQSVEKSNAPSTGTQVKGKERAAEVGEGEKKGLDHEKKAKKEKRPKKGDEPTSGEGEGGTESEDNEPKHEP